MTRIPALTLWRPWTACFTEIPGPAAKRVENRSWRTYHRGPVYLHAGQRFDESAVHLANRIWARFDPHWTVGDVRFLLATDEPVLSDNPADHAVGIVAVADLVDVCMASLYSATLLCDCGPWAFAKQAHWRFDNVRKLPEAVPCRGAQQLWTVPADVEAAVLSQLAVVTS